MSTPLPENLNRQHLPLPTGLRAEIEDVIRLAGQGATHVLEQLPTDILAASLLAVEQFKRNVLTDKNKAFASFFAGGDPMSWIEGPGRAASLFATGAKAGAGRWFSRFEEAVKGAKAAKQTGSQWLATLNKAPGGTWKAEREWTGIDNFLLHNSDRVLTRDEVLAAAAPRSIKIKETVLDSKTNPLNPPEFAREDLLLPGGQKQKEILLQLDDDRINFVSSHYSDDPNIIAHIRLNTRKLPNGEKVLFVEELQSDWSQAGRKHGFGIRPIPPAEEFTAVVREPVFPGSTATWWVEHPGEGFGMWADKFDSEGNVRSIEEVIEEARVEMQAIRMAGGAGGVPETPFKRTEDWLGLAMKRVIDEAAAGGYDRVAWTTGKQQADRYSLTKYIDEIRYTSSVEGSPGIFIAYDHNGREVMNRTMYPDELPAYIGEELSTKLLTTEEKQLGSLRTLRLTGQDIEIGGEGMKGFYDQIVPKWVEKYGKKLGVKIEVEPTPSKGNPPGWTARQGAWAEHEPDRWRVFDETGRVRGNTYANSAEEAIYDIARDLYADLSSNPSFRITPEIQAAIAQGQSIGAASPDLLKLLLGAGAAATAGGFGLARGRDIWERRER